MVNIAVRHGGLYVSHGASPRSARRARLLPDAALGDAHVVSLCAASARRRDDRERVEPACGEGHMAEIVTEFASGQVIASDVFDYGYGQAPVDFVNDEPLARPEVIITNP